MRGLHEGLAGCRHSAAHKSDKLMTSTLAAKQTNPHSFWCARCGEQQPSNPHTVPRGRNPAAFKSLGEDTPQKQPVLKPPSISQPPQNITYSSNCRLQHRTASTNPLTYTVDNKPQWSTRWRASLRGAEALQLDTEGAPVCIYHPPAANMHMR